MPSTNLANTSAFRQRSLPPGPQPCDITCQTQTPAAPQARHHSAHERPPSLSSEPARAVTVRVPLDSHVRSRIRSARILSLRVCGAWEMPRMTSSRRWKLSSHSMRLATFLSITVALILIAPIALASPPDPSWVSGIYDGADGDDVVSLIYDTAG